MAARNLDYMTTGIARYQLNTTLVRFFFSKVQFNDNFSLILHKIFIVRADVTGCGLGFSIYCPGLIVRLFVRISSTPHNNAFRLQKLKIPQL
jgi:hypothetical protein